MHTVLGLVRKELEVTLAVLVLLAFVVGFSFAQTPTTETPAADTQVAVIQTDKIQYNGRTYSGLSFGAAKSGMLTVKGFTSTGAQYYTSPLGLTLVDPSATYTLELALDAELDDNKWYTDGDNATLTINGQTVTSPTQGISLVGAKSIKIVTKGGINLRTFSHTPGSSSTTTIKTVKTLYLAPATTFLVEGTTRSFLVVALDESGSSIDTKGIAKWTVSNTSVATINATTGVLTALKAGTVEVTVTVGTAKATATVTVQPKVEQPEIVNEPTTEAGKQIVALPSTSTTTKTQTAPDAPAQTSTTATTQTGTATDTKAPEATTTTTVDTAIQSLFSKEAVAARLVAEGNASPTQAQINQVAATISSPVARIGFRISAAAQEIGLTLRTIFVGNAVTNPATGDRIVTRSAIQVIGSLIGNLLTGGNPASQAGTMRITPGEELQ